MQRFWTKAILLPNGCLEWQGAKNGKGYGRFMLNGRNRYAHNVAWELRRGSIPPGLMVCHHCDNPSCVNPEHLFLGTNSDNIRDMVAKGRGNYRNGERHPKAKLARVAVAEIKASSLTHTELARRFNVTPKAIAFIRQGINWRHT